MKQISSPDDEQLREQSAYERITIDRAVENSDGGILHNGFHVFGHSGYDRQAAKWVRDAMKNFKKQQQRFASGKHKEPSKCIADAWKRLQEEADGIHDHIVYNLFHNNFFVTGVGGVGESGEKFGNLPT